MKTITFLTGTFNEVANVDELLRRVWQAAKPYEGRYRFEYIFIDNASTDGTQDLLRSHAAADRRIKVIINMRNFGQVRSGYHVFLQATGDAAIGIAADLQDPPELIPEFLDKWEQGYKVVMGVKTESEESPLFFMLRRCYYAIVSGLSDVKLLKNVTGFGLYDRTVRDEFKKLDDPYPYMRGLISELGYPVALVAYSQPRRRRGISKNNFYSLYDFAMLGVTSFTKIPLRIATMFGFAMSLLFFAIAICYFVFKLLFWDRFPLGTAPVIIGLFLVASVQLFFIGILGEYIGAIHTQVLHRPHVVEKERINF